MTVLVGTCINRISFVIPAASSCNLGIASSCPTTTPLQTAEPSGNMSAHLQSVSKVDKITGLDCIFVVLALKDSKSFYR
jgi:hypothetical protein